jgi:hypothetical protein
LAWISGVGDKFFKGESDEKDGVSNEMYDAASELIAASA